MQRRFVTIDVFTTTKGAGNPLAVVLDAEGLTDAQMQLIAREFNLSETTFILPPRQPGHLAFVRIFMPGRELPFAGHPVIGTSLVLATIEREKRSAVPTSLTIEVPLGEVSVDIGSDPGGEMIATCAAPKVPVAHMPSPNAEQVAAALSIATSELANDVPIETWDAGYAVTFVALASADVVSRSKVDLAKWPSPDAFGRPVSLFPYAKTGQHRLYARMFAPALGIPEDPATGGAAVAMAGHLHAHRCAEDGSHRFEIVQGVDMGRPSRIALLFDAEHNRLTRIRIAGAGAEFMHGVFVL
ncbi:MAG: PhzF family phenazine biosynthesis protein [Xanthobacteraceae bacterium]